MGEAETRVFAKLRSSLPKQKPDRKRTGLAWSRVVYLSMKNCQILIWRFTDFNFIFSL